MSNPYKTKQFRKLQNTWYKKLAKSGFKDIEETGHDDPFLKRWHKHDIATAYESGRAQETEKYFRVCRQFLNQHNFDTGTEKLIWALHSEGKSVREIAKEVEYEKSHVHNIITALRKRMLGT